MPGGPNRFWQTFDCQISIFAPVVANFSAEKVQNILQLLMHAFKAFGNRTLNFKRSRKWSSSQLRLSIFTKSRRKLLSVFQKVTDVAVAVVGDHGVHRRVRVERVAADGVRGRVARRVVMVEPVVAHRRGRRRVI